MSGPPTGAPEAVPAATRHTAHPAPTVPASAAPERAGREALRERLVGARLGAAAIDLDGTMVDTVDDFTAALNLMLDQLGAAPIDRTEVAGLIGKGSEHLIHSVLASRPAPGAPEARFEHAFAIYQDAYRQVNGRGTRLFPDVQAGLRALREAGLVLACVTNKPHRFALELLQQYDLAQYFEVVYGGDSLAHKKPHPLPLLTACATLRCDPARAVAIGDSENDALAARAAGMLSLTVPYGYNHGNPVQTINTDGIVSTLLDAADLIRTQR